jgi:subtilisin family serine protease
MNRLALAGLLALATAACGGGGGDTAPSPPAPTPPVAVSPPPAATAGAEIVVMLQPGADIVALATSRGARVIERFGTRPIWRLEAARGASLATTLAAWRATPGVRFAEAGAEGSLPIASDRVVWAVDRVVWAVGQGEVQAAAQWAPAALALAEAHALARGEGVRVAVIDTGFELGHPLLAPRWARDGAGRVLGRDFVDDDTLPAEDGREGDRGWGHGTHVAGIVAQAAPGASLLPVRVLDRSGRGNAWVLAEALMWALDPDGDLATDDGARVLNFSLATPEPTRLLRAAISLARCDDDDDDDDIDLDEPGFEADKARCEAGRGAVVMAAAGNDAGTTPQYPAAESLEGLLAVAAAAQGGGLADFSNRGPWVGLAAPGDRIVSAWPGGQYATASGSSMATPWAAGVAALVLQRNPDWKPVDVTKRLQDRSRAVCGEPGLRSLHAHGAVADFVPEPGC